MRVFFKWAVLSLAAAFVVVCAVPLILLGLIAINFAFATPILTPMTMAFDERSLSIERKARHPYLAEYDRALVVFHGDVEVKRTTLAMDTGGTSHLNIYRTGDDTLALVDRFTLHIVNLSDGSVSKTSRVSGGDPSRALSPQAFVGAFNNVRDGRSRTYRFVPAAEQDKIAIEPAQGG